MSQYFLPAALIVKLIWKNINAFDVSMWFLSRPMANYVCQKYRRPHKWIKVMKIINLQQSVNQINNCY